MVTLELAKPQMLKDCYEIVDMGREFQKAQGFTQWTKDYPNLETIRQDIREGKGYVVMAEDRIAGYMCVDFDGEPAYEHIDGKWRAELPYAVVHRMAFLPDFRGRGLTGTTFSLIEELCRRKGAGYLRADTDFPNKRMQHVLQKCGFVHCGTVIFQGSGKLAYDKLF